MIEWTASMDNGSIRMAVRGYSADNPYPYGVDLVMDAADTWGGTGLRMVEEAIKVLREDWGISP